MKVGKIYRESELLIEHVWRADTVLTRARGLLGRPPLEMNQGLVITPCSSVHTIGMQYALDIVFVDAVDNDAIGSVIKLYSHLGKWRTAIAMGAAWTLELKAGEISRLNIAVGDKLQWRAD